MNCPNCGKEVPFQAALCEGCGQELKIYKKIVSASNSFYNIGLKKAQIRDLSGAAVSLKKSLKLNKKNTKARNLLGLVYYEMGEVVQALSQWVISKNFQSEKNEADQYMAAIQKNPSRLEAINQTIKKYNNALVHAQQGSYDLAIMQLEKAVSLNPRFIRSYQLLGLLYMEEGQYKKASRSLLKARKIDKNNPLTVYYMDQLPEKPLEEKKGKPSGKARETFQPETDVSVPVFTGSSYKEERFNIWPYLNLVIGAALGIAVVYFLLVPTAQKSVAANYEKQMTEYNDQLSAQSVKSASLENENKDLKKERDRLQEKLDELTAESKDTGAYDKFYEAVRQYIDGNSVEAAKILSDVKESDIENKTAKAIYNSIKSTTFEGTAEDLAEEGRVTYNNGKYEEAIETLNKALALDPDNVKAIYFLGRCYHRMGEYDKAREYYNTIVNDYPDSDRAAEAASRLRELQ